MREIDNQYYLALNELFDLVKLNQDSFTVDNLMKFKESATEDELLQYDILSRKVVELTGTSSNVTEF